MICSSIQLTLLPTSLNRKTHAPTIQIKPAGGPTTCYPTREQQTGWFQDRSKVLRREAWMDYAP